jgi:alkane 1-monooxygenase
MKQWFSVAGYLAMFVPLVVLVVGHTVGFEWAPVVLFLGIYPLVRVITGEVKESQPEWTEAASRALAAMPVVYAVCFLGVYAWVLCEFAGAHARSTADNVGFTVGIVVTAALGACVSHTLVHSRSVMHKRLGSLMLALYGYPFFRAEHMAHHAMPRHVEAGHCPTVKESVWWFAIRRLWTVPVEAMEWSRGVQARAREASVLDSLWLWCAISVASFAAMTWASGLYGAVSFIVFSVVLPMLNSFIVYIQHWGLGVDNGQPGGVRVQVGWEDRCRMQALTTLNLSLHQHHHERPNDAYFRLQPSERGPVLPAGYGVMVLIAMVPPLWRRSMLPRLESWKSAPLGQLGAGNGLYCLRVNGPTKKAEAT